MEGTVTLKPFTVMYIEKQGPPQLSAEMAFRQLEKTVPSQGRKFYGIWDSKKGKYCACVKMHDGDDPKKLDLSVMTVAGGKYARRNIKGQYQDIVSQISSVFAAMENKYEVDPARLPIEFYKSRTEIQILLPII